MSKTQPTHGGKRPGAGRPTLPPEERRTELFSIRLTADEKALLESTDAKAWAREMLVKAARKKQ